MQLPTVVVVYYFILTRASLIGFSMFYGVFYANKRKILEYFKIGVERVISFKQIRFF